MEKWFSLSGEDFDQLNPNTKTCPIFRSKYDAELSKKIYGSHPIILREPTEGTPEENPWGIDFDRMFDMSTDSGLFRDSIPNDGNAYLPLYEAKLIHQFDHRWATYVSSGIKVDTVDSSIEQKLNFEYKINPKSWIEEKHILAQIARVPTPLSKAYTTGDSQLGLYTLGSWVEESVGEVLFQEPKQTVIEAGGSIFEKLPDNPKTWRNSKVKTE